MGASDPNLLKKIIVEAPSASAAVKALYAHNKAQNPKLSLAYFCGKAGIKSKGYLGDILAGRRTLNPRYAAPLGAAFGLKGPVARAFVLLAQVESGGLDGDKLKEAEAKLATLRRSLAVERGEPLPSDLARMSMAFEVYCAFGLYGNAPDRADLLRYFGERHAEELDAALALLVRHELVEDRGGRLSATKKAVVFGASGSGFDHLDFLRSSLRDAERALKSWFPRRDEAYLESVILSVRRDDFLRLLPLIRERLLEARTELDTETGADMLVRFNVQIYPVRSRTSGD